LTDGISSRLIYAVNLSTQISEFPYIVLAMKNDERAALAAMKEGLIIIVLFGNSAGWLIQIQNL
jgi:hypothetical protein